MTKRAALIVLVANALVSLGLLCAYAVLLAPTRTPRLAVLDVAELYRMKEKEVTALLAKHDATDADRAAALERASTFGAEVTSLIERLPGECRCLVLARGAIVGTRESLPDLTPGVRQRLGL